VCVLRARVYKREYASVSYSLFDSLRQVCFQSYIYTPGTKGAGDKGSCEMRPKKYLAETLFHEISHLSAGTNRLSYPLCALGPCRVCTSMSICVFVFSVHDVFVGCITVHQRTAAFVLIWHSGTNDLGYSEALCLANVGIPPTSEVAELKLVRVRILVCMLMLLKSNANSL